MIAYVVDRLPKRARELAPAAPTTGVPGFLDTWLTDVRR